MRLSILFISLVVIFTSACAESSSSESAMVSTIYYKPIISEAKNCESNDFKDLRDRQGKILYTMCSKVYKSCLMQGSCLIREGNGVRSFNYVGYSKKEEFYYFHESDLLKCPFGYGVRSGCLDPYFSVAADPDHFKYGDVIFVPQLVGLELPDGQIHDGYLIVRDTGGGIKGPNRFDFFVGLSANGIQQNIFAKLGFGDKKSKIEFQRVSNDQTLQIRNKRNFPSLPSDVLAHGLELVK